MVVAVIADIVGSRRLPDRSEAQRLFDETIARVDGEHPLAERGLRPTVGDEQQGVYRALEDALASLLLLQLALPDGIEFRFGVGIGQIHPVESEHRSLSDGPGWWAAREAIEIAHERQQRAVPSSRTWIVGAPGQTEVMDAEIAVSNMYLLARDAIVTRMSGRERRLAYGRFSGLSQRALAEQEGITQPAVSKALHASGATALLDGLTMLMGGAR
ncbi:SatD family protein [uncultured Microbacterium sp.]|uniref:SatD family protein n=1 Tax=uncultured Microbacterium sp. TaxID=191216 RepID=UPI0026017467|nr:SatD family protein [uncultured Microbacterium sp.]